MPTFSTIIKGTRAVKVIDFPADNTRCALLADLPELAAQRAQDAQAAARPEQATPEAQPKIGLRVLTGIETAECLHKAREFAISKGVASPAAGDPIYDLGIMVHTLAIGCVDPDSPESSRALFFDGGASQILEGLDQDRIAFLYARHEIWQDECSPQALRLTTQDAYAHIVKVTVSDDDTVFTQMRPGLAWTLFRFMACQLLSKPEHRSSFILGLEATGTSVTRLVSVPRDAN